MIATTRPEMSVSEPTLYVAFELGKKEWKLAMTSGFGVEPWVRTVAEWRSARAVERALRAGAAAVRVAGAAPGRELLRSGPRRVLDSSRADGAGDRESGGGFGEHRGESARAAGEDGSARCAQAGDGCWCGCVAASGACGAKSTCPTVAEEAARQVSRERTALTQEQTRLINQMRGWLATWGVTLPARRRGAWWTTVRDWAGAALPRRSASAARPRGGAAGGPRGADRGARRAAAGGGDAPPRRRVRCGSWCS